MGLHNVGLSLLAIFLLAWTPFAHAEGHSADAPPTALPSENHREFSERTPARTVQVTLPDTTVESASVTLPIRASGLGGANVTSYQFTLTYDASVINITGVDASNTLSSSGSVTDNPSEGELKVSYAAAESIDEDGVLLKLEVEIVGSGQSSLQFTELRFFDVDAQEVQSSSESGQVATDTDTEAPSAPTDVSLTSEGSDVELSWSLSSSDDVAHQLVYRGTTAQFDTTGQLLQTVDATATSFTDSSLEPGTTYHYRIAAVDGAGNTSALSESVSALSVDINRSFEDASSEQNYKLVALPGDADMPLQATLSGEAGSDWQAWWDDGSDEDFLIKFDGSDQFTFTRGRGFWLISTNDWSVQTALNATSLLEGATTLPLHDGWNIISNPLDQDVSWSAVSAANGNALQTLWRWDGSFTEANQFQSATSGEAYYFLNDQNLDELTLPLPTTTQSSNALTASNAHQDRSTLTLEAYQNGQVTSRVRVGVHPDAKVGIDSYDQFAPPSRFEASSLRLNAPESARSDRLRYLAHEWRPEISEGQSFDLVLQRTTDAPVHLQTAGLDAFAGREVALIHEATGQSYDLRTNPTIPLQSESDPTMLRLVIGTTAFVADETSKATPDKLELRPTYPNPFSGQTTVAYAVPERTEVRIAVYDVVGRRVQVLHDSEQRAGVHRLQWNGRSQTGQPVASGLYFVRLEAMGQQQVQKVTFVR